MNKALQELRTIAKINHLSAFNGDELRIQAIEDWITRWVIELTQEQTVLHQKELPFEIIDAVKEHMAKELSETIIEECANFQSKTPDHLTIAMHALRRRAK